MPAHACVAHQIYQNGSVSNEDHKSNKKVTVTGVCLTSIPYFVIKNRSKIVELTVDDNFLNENSFNMPKFLNLRKLSVKNNKIQNVKVFLANLRRSCPNIENLQIDKNPGWPVKLTDSEKQWIRIYLNKLQFLNETEHQKQ